MSLITKFNPWTQRLQWISVEGSLSSLDDLPDGSTYGRVKQSELLSGKVLSLDSMVTTDGAPSYTLGKSIIPDDAESLLDLGSLLKYFQSIYSEDIRINTFRSLDGSVSANSENVIEASALRHTQGTDAGASGSFNIVGELTIKVYSQDAEPTLDTNNKMAIWIDTNDSNRTYLLFRRGSGDHLKVELA